jgi:hypothetical protein
LLGWHDPCLITIYTVIDKDQILMTTDNHSIEKLFAEKPESLKLFHALQKGLEALGDVKQVITKTQVSFGAKRKFAWLWLAPATKKTPEGVLMLTLDMTHKVTHPMITSVEETYTDKWTHQIAVKDEATMREIDKQGWLAESYKFGSMERKKTA